MSFLYKTRLIRKKASFFLLFTFVDAVDVCFTTTARQILTLKAVQLGLCESTSVSDLFQHVDFPRLPPVPDLVSPPLLCLDCRSQQLINQYCQERCNLVTAQQKSKVLHSQNNQVR